MARDGLLNKMFREPVAHAGRTFKPNGRILFGAAESEVIECGNVDIKVQEWLKIVHVRTPEAQHPALVGSSRVWEVTCHRNFVEGRTREQQYGKALAHRVWITASTMLTALALDGVTIHCYSAAGLKRGNGKAKRDLLEAQEMKARVKNRWRQVKAMQCCH